MDKKYNIAIIGGGVVGSICSFILAENKHQVTLYDDEIYSATKAALGIICPWFSQRRNKPWLKLVLKGSEFYYDLNKMLKELDIDTSYFRENGTIILRKEKETLLKLQKQGNDLGIQSTLLTPNQIKKIFPSFIGDENGLLVKSGSSVDGLKMIETFKQAAFKFNFRYFKKTININDILSDYDYIICCAGIGNKKILEDLGFDIDLRASKGQLIISEPLNVKENLITLMPKGEIDIMPNLDTSLTVGASHQNDDNFNLEFDENILNKIKKDASIYIQDFDKIEIKEKKLGIRTYTSDYGVFVGKINEKVIAAGGLSSSGLSSGPYIAKIIKDIIEENQSDIDLSLYDPKKYLKNKEK